jgi:hypothetical protein
MCTLIWRDGREGDVFPALLFGRPYFVDAAGHASNPYLAVFFVGADLGDDGFRDPLPRRFVDLLKRRNRERDVLADHLPIRPSCSLVRHRGPPDSSRTSIRLAASKVVRRALP